MAELNLKQIIDRLNAEFTGETRKLVFWYDDKAEFAEDMETVELQNAKIYRLQPDNQFYTKYFLERVDKTTNYLIYAPFPITNDDPTSNAGRQTMIFYDCNTDGGVLAKFDADGEYLDEDIEGTFEDFSMPESFANLDGFLTN